MNVQASAGTAMLSRADVADLEMRVAGPVLLPDHADYPAECATFNLMTPVRPAVAIGAASVADIHAAVQFAANHDLPIAVLTTGHQVVRSAEGAVLINMSRMDAVDIDPARRLARVEGGVRWGQVVDEADKHGLAPVSGTSPTVGVVGYHLGGGLSPILARTHGYAADHIQAIEILTADGALRRITGSSEPDLFWALRGGKGNFGVVTALEFALFPIGTLYGGGLIFGGEHAAKLLHTWREWVNGLPTDMSSSIVFLRLPALPTVPEPLRGTFVMQVRFSSLRPQREAERMLAALRGIAPTILDTIRELPYREVGSAFMESPMPRPWVERSSMLRDFTAEAADALLGAVGPDSSAQVRFVELRLLGGALDRPPAVTNAVPGRNARWSLFGAGGGEPAQIPVIQQHLAALIDAVAPWAQAETMPNLLAASQGTTAEELRAIYGPDRYDRLVAIKQRYDPRNLFRMNHNIRPAPSQLSDPASGPLTS
jgi:FAD/FMN-containing dehydrogenase